MSVDTALVLEEAEDLVLELSESKLKDREAVIRSVAQFLDAILPLDVLVPGPTGQVLEPVSYTHLTLPTKA